VKSIADRTIDCAIETLGCMDTERASAPINGAIVSPTRTGMSHQPCAHAPHARPTRASIPQAGPAPHAASRQASWRPDNSSAREWEILRGTQAVRQPLYRPLYRELRDFSRIARNSASLFHVGIVGELASSVP